MCIRSLNLQQIADMHGASTRTIRRWMAKEGFPRRDDKTFDAAATVRWRVKREVMAAVTTGRYRD